MNSLVRPVDYMKRSTGENFETHAVLDMLPMRRIQQLPTRHIGHLPTRHIGHPAAAMLTPRGFGQSIAVTGDTLPPRWFGHYEMILRPACLGTLPRRLFGQATQRHIGQPTAVMISTRYLRFALGGHPIFSDPHIQ